MKLSHNEEEIMVIIWQGKRVFAKDILDALPEPKPAATTVYTLLKRISDKGIIGYDIVNNIRCYYPLVKKEDYFSKEVKGMIASFFYNSTAQFASFFAKSSNLSIEELEELRNIIDKEIDKKKN
ncbi:BlaI/MecI/CopY family transcriptional regulator [Vaginella massiliensis]|uniref:BlaI/MecI/CopY family transcriptional regulator n=1 Tax=Vaginella massiliensis TaxID=1816680 RepID=UPI000838B11B|nr:BlaI/MecI/CopY family transcriptional regulator [Vaginella massiliensis]